MQTNGSNIEQLTLISHRLCPYVQRAVIAMEEKGIAYKRIDIDLNNKPDWFLKLSPLGKVPVLVINHDTVLFESSVIAEYINEIGDSGLLSSVPLEKARQRAWIEFASATLNNIGQLYNAVSRADFEQAEKQLYQKFGQLENILDGAVFKEALVIDKQANDELQGIELKDTELPNDKYFSGKDYSLVDAAFAPVFRYFDVFEKFVEFKCLPHFQKVNQWRDALAVRTSTERAVAPEYPELLMKFLAVRGSYLGKLAKHYLTEAVTA